MSGGGSKRPRLVPRPARQGGRKRRSRRKTITYWAALAAVVTAVFTVVIPALRSAAGWTDHVIAGGAGGRVELTRVVVGNGTAVLNSADGAIEQTPASTPQVDLTVRNDRTDTVMLDGVVVAIDDSARFPQCIPPQGGGPVPVSKYTVDLPLLPTSQRQVESYSILDQVPPGEVDRPLLRFAVPRVPEESHFLYALRIHVLTDHGERIDVGSFVLALPGALDRGGLVFPEDAHALRYETQIFKGQRLDITWCFRRNLAALRRLIAKPGLRSEDVRALAHMQLAGNWTSYADQRSPRAAAKALLHAQREGPELAAFAASRTGDPRFAALIRRQGEALLLKEGERELYDNEEPLLAAADARDSLGLRPSGRGRALLLHAEAATRAQEAKYARR